MHNVTEYEAKALEWASPSSPTRKDAHRESADVMYTDLRMETLAGKYCISNC